MINIESIKTLSTGISRFADVLYRADANQELYFAFRDSLSRAQLQSKIHLLELAMNSEVPSDKALFIGHWHGLLPFLFLKSKLSRVAMGVEINSLWKEISEHICMNLSWNSILQDATTLSEDFYNQQSFDCVINTSCEHMNFSWLKPIPKDTWIIAQANNYPIPEHTNIQHSLNDFKQNLALSTTTTATELDFSIYKRFTVIGRK